MILSTELTVTFVWIGLLALAFAFNKAVASFTATLDKTPPTPTQKELIIALDLDVARSELRHQRDQFDYEKTLLEHRIQILETELSQSKAAHNEILKQVISRMSG